MTTIQCDGKSARDINREIRQYIADGECDLTIARPSARHNLGIALLQPVRLAFDGSVGYYCAGMNDGATFTVQGSTGWGLAEGMMNGEVIIEGSAGNGAGAAIRGGTIAIKGHAGARAGVSMKGGLIVIGGNCGYMAGFMAQKGTIIICGNAGEALGDSMYEGTIYVGGEIAGLGNDAVIQEPTGADAAFLTQTLDRYSIPNPQSPIPNFKKVVAGRKLWNFDKSELIWREAL